MIGFGFNPLRCLLRIVSPGEQRCIHHYPQVQPYGVTYVTAEELMAAISMVSEGHQVQDSEGGQLLQPGAVDD